MERARDLVEKKRGSCVVLYPLDAVTCAVMIPDFPANLRTLRIKRAMNFPLVRTPSLCLTLLIFKL
jgi:hypothetical protein